MIIKELFEGLVGDYCIARNTIKCLFIQPCSVYVCLHMLSYFAMFCVCPAQEEATRVSFEPPVIPRPTRADELTVRMFDTRVQDEHR